MFNLLDVHPVTAEQLVRIGLFPTVKIAQRRLIKLVQKKKIWQLGTALMNDRGRPCNVYSRARFKVDNLRHEVLLTEFLLAFLDGDIVRGYDLHEKQRPDAKFTSDGKTYFVELDCGTMNYQHIISKRFRKYEDYEGLVLWVALTDVRKEGLRSRASIVSHNALFTTLNASLMNPYGGVWQDYEGNITSVEKPEEKSSD